MEKKIIFSRYELESQNVGLGYDFLLLNMPKKDEI